MGLLLAAAALAPGAVAYAQSGGICQPGGKAGKVSILVVVSPERVHRFAASLGHVPVVRRGPETVVFADGRVVTSNVEAAGNHLSALSWGNREIQIVGSFTSRGRWKPG